MGLELTGLKAAIKFSNKIRKRNLQKRKPNLYLHQCSSLLARGKTLNFRVEIYWSDSLRHNQPQHSILISNWAAVIQKRRKSLAWCLLLEANQDQGSRCKSLESKIFPFYNLPIVLIQRKFSVDKVINSIFLVQATTERIKNPGTPTNNQSRSNQVLKGLQIRRAHIKLKQRQG